MQTAKYYALETDDGLTMELGVNPPLQFGLRGGETREELYRTSLYYFDEGGLCIV